MLPPENRTGSLIGVIFSLNRAMQLQAALHSLLLNCQDAQRLELFVLYKTTSPVHSRQYARLVAEFDQYPNLHFQPENIFRKDLLSLLARHASLSAGRFKMFLNTLRLGGGFGWLGNQLLTFSHPVYVLFLVDDNIFVQPFCLFDVMGALGQQPSALGFSLRLGKNTTYCYTDGCAQALPDFFPYSANIQRFDWTVGKHDFHYPLEVSSSIYRLSEILPFINRMRFHDPNTLESCMWARRAAFGHSQPDLLCFESSVTFCNPVNRVVQNFKNRAAEKYDYPNQFLAEQFEAGYRINVASYQGFVASGCHQEVELNFIKIPGE
jgi:hypothetical protein